MDGFLSLHSLAASRGDGLHPKLLELMEAQALINAPGGNIADIALRRGETLIQAGPHPVGDPGDALPEGVYAWIGRKRERMLRGTRREVEG